MSLHAIIIQSLIMGKTVYQLPFYVTAVLSMLMAIFLSLVISKIQPAKGLMITVLTIVGTLSVSYLIFAIFGYWIYLTHKRKILSLY